ncbi:uracil phosphoribosyltransferase-domain-containing protein [Whalleya microplaca]|nr:uracil phosphoribosyltransferase-domain-containing protein [Whalleya microplaca]
METSCEGSVKLTGSTTASIQLIVSNASKAPTISQKKAAVIGLYGIPGCGKSILLKQLKQELGQEHFEFYEGSKVIAAVIPGGLPAFQELDESQRSHWRGAAIDKIGKEASDSGRTAIVAGHIMFWSNEEKITITAYTENDLRIYTDIFYLVVPAEIIAQRCHADKERTRPHVSIKHLQQWQNAEKSLLVDICHQNNISLSLCYPCPSLLNEIATRLRVIHDYPEEENLALAKHQIDKKLLAHNNLLETIIVLDGDGTLAAADTGALFWKMLNDEQKLSDPFPLKTLFSSPLGYSYEAFRQAASLYGGAVDKQEFEPHCERVASAVTMHPELVSLIRGAQYHEHISVVVITCGLQLIWEKILNKNGLSKVQVIGAGRIADGLIITPTVKAVLVRHLREIYRLYVWAFGDSPLDLPMLKEADQAVVIVGHESTRSRSMEPDLSNAIDNDNLRARQVLLPSTVSHRLDPTRLPEVRLRDSKFIASIMGRRIPRLTPNIPGLRVIHATEKSAAKMLMTPTRDARNAGPVLREAHHRIGWYLATEYLTDVVGLEEYSMPHVEGNQTTGFRLCEEKRLLIVALMRAGEALAFGINEAFPLAKFLHGFHPEDIETEGHHLTHIHTVVLVDAVINSGKTLSKFVHHIRNLDANIPIVVVAGVVQANAISGGEYSRVFTNCKNLTIVALRFSENQFTGRGGTDTGNRLFNTTDLPSLPLESQANRTDDQ